MKNEYQHLTSPSKPVGSLTSKAKKGFIDHQRHACVSGINPSTPGHKLYPCYWEGYEIGYAQGFDDSQDVNKEVQEQRERRWKSSALLAFRRGIEDGVRLGTLDAKLPL